MPRVAPAVPDRLPLSIFLSSTSEDLLEHRKAVIEVIEGLGQLPSCSETLFASPENPLEICTRLARTADATVVIVGNRYGHIPASGAAQESWKSMVRHEVEAAADAGKSLFCYFAKEELHEGSKEQELLAEFRLFLQDLKPVVYDRFTCAKDLARRVAIALGRWVFRDQEREFATALRLLNLGEHPSPPPRLRLAELLPVRLLDLVLAGSALVEAELDPALEGRHLASAQKNFTESLFRYEKESSALEERLAKWRSEERQLSARIELLEQRRLSTPPTLAASATSPEAFEMMGGFPRHKGQTESPWRMYQEQYHAQSENFDRQWTGLRLDLLRQSVEQAEFSLIGLRQQGESERRRLNDEIGVARAKDIVHLVQGMWHRSLLLLEEPTTIGQGFLLLLSAALMIPVLNRHLAGYAVEAIGVDMVAEKLYVAGEEAVRRDPQALGRDALALAVALSEGWKEGEQAAAEVLRILESVPSEALRRFGLQQQKLLRFSVPVKETFKATLDPDSIAKEARRIERDRREVGDTLTAMSALEAETAEFLEVAKEAGRKADGLHKRSRARVADLWPFVEDCRRLWKIFSQATARSVLLGRETRRFCACLTDEVATERRLGEPLESLLVRCESLAFGLRDVKALCAKHPVTAYLARAEELRQRRPELEKWAADLDRASRKLAEQPQIWAKEYREELRLTVLWSVVPLFSLRKALKGGALIRRFAPALRSDHRAYRGLAFGSLPWLDGAALISVLGAIGLGCAIPPVLANSEPLWAATLSLFALDYILGLALWTVQRTSVLILWRRGRNAKHDIDPPVRQEHIRR